MRLGLLALTNGRDGLLGQALASAMECLVGGFAVKVIHDDTGRPDHRQALSSKFPGFRVIGQDSCLGFGGAISNAWGYLSSMDLDYIFHLEDDFIFNEEISLSDLVTVLECDRNVQQVALQRQAWNEEEKIFGGLLNVRSESYTDAEIGGVPVVLHRNYFTTNPSLYRHSLMSRGWSSGENSEGIFGITLFEEQPEAVCSFLGRKSDRPKVHHLGITRTGTSY